MPNFQQILNEEIRRLARKEVKSEQAELKKQLIQMRKTIIELNRRVKALEKAVPMPLEQVKQKAEVAAEKTKPVRITANRIKNLREKLGLSQGKFALLLGVSSHSIQIWEAGKVVPREPQKLKIAAIRDMRKCELVKLMSEKNITAQPSRAQSNANKKNENEQQEQSGKTESKTQGEKTAIRS